ncbi:hypothetical protein FOA43_001945 [Brettanomyces nanus]|uniref:Uncharacterized protein n=1 Tax=Eeniella nana TaxID=13502 RepID=A0A875S125_EENNA|nr:uncharacterized protein FOA43_001945 [Brettanomyces nanus]QPG74613.1 hypothetical protein FOA43_001945 [Brettanomyces nanus]
MTKTEDDEDVLFATAKRARHVYGEGPKKTSSSKVANDAFTLDRFLKVRPSPAKTKNSLNAELGFDIDTAFKKSTKPHYVKELGNIVIAQQKIERAMKKQEKETENEQQKEQELDVLLKDQLADGFVGSSSNILFLKRLKELLSDENNKEELYDFYFFKDRGKWGQATARRSYHLTRSQVMNGLPDETTHWKNVLACLAEETNVDVVNSYDLKGIKNKLDLPTFQKFMLDIGCDDELINAPIGLNIDELRLKLDNKEQLPSMILLALKVYKVTSALDCKDDEVLMKHMVRYLSYACVDIRINQRCVGESAIIDGERSTALQLLLKAIMKLVKKDNSKLIELVEENLDKFPALWFRFIDNLQAPTSWKLSKVFKMTLFQMQSMLEFIYKTNFNDVALRKAKELWSPLQMSELASDKRLCHKFVELVGTFKNACLNGTTLKENRYDPGTKVDTGNYMTNKNAYETAKLRVVCLERLSLLYIIHLEKHPHRRKDAKKIARIRRQVMEIKRFYFHHFEAIVCPPVTDSHGVLSFVVGRLD